MTVRRECGSRRCSHLSDLGSPDIGRGKKKEAKWLAGTPNGSGGSLPLRGSKGVFEQRSWQTDDSHFTPGKRQKTNWDTKDSKILQASIKNSTKSISPWKKKNSPVEPRQKNKISNFGTFFLYTQILFTTLSLSLFEEG